MKRKIYFSLLIGMSSLLLLTNCASLEAKKNDYTILLSGASFAAANNGWFELGCEQLNSKYLNRAIGATAIADAANQMEEGTLYSEKELEEIDVFVLMHVHDQNVADSSQLRNEYGDYKKPFDRSNYAAEFDYVIKRYISDCYNLKFNKNSKYYNTPSGKPAIIVLCTDWHDGRTVYNNSVRRLAEKWGFPIVEFNKYIGFSKNQLHPVTKEQTSLIYSIDDQEIDGTRFGWHPQQGKDKYIQQRMAAIFADKLRLILIQ